MSLSSSGLLNFLVPDQLALINYQNQLQRETNKVAMRQYNNKMYKAMLRFIVAKWVPYSAAMRIQTLVGP